MGPAGHRKRVQACSSAAQLTPKHAQTRPSSRERARACARTPECAAACASVPSVPCPAVSTRRGAAGSGLEGGRRLPAAANGTPGALEAASGPRGHRTSSPGPLPCAHRLPRPSPPRRGLWGARTPLGPWAGSDPAAGGVRAASMSLALKARQKARRKGGTKERVFGCDLLEHLQQSGQDGKRPPVSAATARVPPPVGSHRTPPLGGRRRGRRKPGGCRGEGTGLTHAMQLHHQRLSKRRSRASSRRGPSEILGGRGGPGASARLQSQCPAAAPRGRGWVAPFCRGLWCPQDLRGPRLPRGDTVTWGDGWPRPLLTPPALGRERGWDRGAVGDGGPGVPVPQCPRC